MKFKIEFIDNNDPSILHVKISGSLEGGTDLEETPEMQNLGTKVVRASEDSTIVFDLMDLRGWDTAGIWSLMKPALAISKKYKNRVGFVGSKVNPSLLRQGASKVSELGTPSLPWKDSLEALLTFFETQ